MLDAEQAVLGALLLDCDSIDRLTGLRPEHFTDPLHAVVYREILTITTTGSKADLVTVANRLERNKEIASAGGFGYVAALAKNCAGSANIAQHARLVRDAAANRAMLAASIQIRDLANGRTSIAERLDKAQSLLAEIGEEGSAKESRLIRDVLIDHLSVMEGRWSHTETGIHTGLKSLDDRIQSLKPGNLVVIAARPGMGKTALAMQIARHVAGDSTVLFLSQEMSENELTDRLVSSIGKIPMEKVLHGGMSNEEDEKLGYAVQKLDAMKLFLDDKGGLTLMDVQSKARKIKRKHGLGLVVLDYLQLMSGDGNNRNSEIEVISRGLKALAKDLGCPVIVLSQLSRKCEERNNKRPMLSDLRDSGAIEQDADIVLMLYREEEYDDDSPAKGTAEILIRKNRQGKTGDVRLVFMGEIMTFADYCGGPIGEKVTPIRSRRGGFNYE